MLASSTIHERRRRRRSTLFLEEKEIEIKLERVCWWAQEGGALIQIPQQKVDQTSAHSSGGTRRSPTGGESAIPFFSSFN